MRFTTPTRLAIAGLTVLALAACQDATGPDSLGPDSAVLAKGGNGGGGGGGGGGGPDNPGPPDKKGDLYADLVFLYRDANGLPLLKSYVVEEETVLCVQPVSYTPIPELDTTVPVTVETAVNPVNGLDVWLIPLYGDYMPPPVPEGEATLLAAESEEEVALAPCDPYGELDELGNLVLTYGDFADEVGFGRLNLGRAPQRTVDRAYSEVEIKLSAASAFLLDHAGRWAPDAVAIDAPAENLVIHREMVTRGQFGTYLSPTPQPWYGYLHHAASTLAGAADKFGVINEDLVVYNNRILGFPENVTGTGMTTILGDGVNGFPGEKYLDYRGFTYTRSAAFPGCVVAGTWDPDGNPIRIEGTIMGMVFGGVDWSGENINAFATRADDARAVILYEHDYWIYAIDRIGETAVCDAIGFE